MNLFNDISLYTNHVWFETLSLVSSDVAMISLSVVDGTSPIRLVWGGDGIEQPQQKSE